MKHQRYISEEYIIQQVLKRIKLSGTANIDTEKIVRVDSFNVVRLDDNDIETINTEEAKQLLNQFFNIT